MDQLYGTEVAAQVFKRIESLDPDLKIQRIAYDHYWSRPGLSLHEKSTVTLAALIAMGREEQTQIHRSGFLNSGGTQPELDALFKAVESVRSIPVVIPPDHANPRSLGFIQLAAAVALTQQQRMIEVMQGFLQSVGTREDLKKALIHLIPYCGFPSVMNAFAALQQAE